jgi:4-hydroxybenzoate polyprenyltransferase
MIKNYFKILRFHHYIKNLFIFLPLVFGLKLFDFGAVSKTFIALVGFSLLTSAVYIINDLRDIEEDRNHPVKKNRPLASGAVRKATTYYLIAILLILSSVIALFLNADIFSLFLIYFIFNLLYTFKLKHHPIIDVGAIAVSFVIRLFVGSAAADIPLSMWIIVMTFLLALFIAFAKRRDDVLIYLQDGKRARKVVDGYNLEFLNMAMAIMAAVLIVTYILYSISPEIIVKTHSDKLYLTTIFVILGILRYLQIAFVGNKSGTPTEVLLKDRFIQASVLLWLSTFIFILYY